MLADTKVMWRRMIYVHTCINGNSAMSTYVTAVESIINYSSVWSSKMAKMASHNVMNKSMLWRRRIRKQGIAIN
jgi:hypothetical protein